MSLEDLARVGDAMGPFASLFSFLALAAALFSLNLQRQELGLQRQELGLQRQEMQLQRAALQEQAAELRGTKMVQQAQHEALLATARATGRQAALAAVAPAAQFAVALDHANAAIHFAHTELYQLGKLTGGPGAVQADVRHTTLARSRVSELQLSLPVLAAAPMRDVAEQALRVFWTAQGTVLSWANWAETQLTVRPLEQLDPELLARRRAACEASEAFTAKVREFRTAAQEWFDRTDGP